MNITTDMQSINNLPIVNPFSNKIINNRLSIPSRNLNNELYLNIKYNIKKKYEGRTIKYGYISKIYRLIKYENNYVEINNLDCNPFFFVKFSARICNPIINTIIITKVTKINKNFIVSENGPITCIIKTNQINLNNFNVNNKGDIVYTKNNSVLKIGNHVIVKIIGVQFVVGDERIIIISSLEDLATKEIVNKFYIQDHNTEKIDEINDIESLDTIETSDEEEI